MDINADNYGFDHEILDKEPEWIEDENPDVNAGRKDYWSKFIMANILHGFTIDQICNLMIHPATGMHPTPNQLIAAFPIATQPDAGLATFTAEVFNTALYGERGDKSKAQQLIADRIAGDRWRAPSKKLDVTVDGSVEHQHKVEQVDKAMFAVAQVMDAIGKRKKRSGDDAKLIESSAAIESEIVDAEVEYVIEGTDDE